MAATALWACGQRREQQQQQQHRLLRVLMAAAALQLSVLQVPALQLSAL
jgi:hypothetical protein